MSEETVRCSRFYSPDVHKFFSQGGLGLQKSQNYFPLMSYLFRSQKASREMTFRQRYYLVNVFEALYKDKKPYDFQSKIFAGLVYDTRSKKGLVRDVFFKLSNIIDPVTLVKGSYGDISRPHLISALKENSRLNHKLFFQFNTAYVESLAYHLLSGLREKGVCPHFPIVYGVYNAAADSFLTEFTDEYRRVHTSVSFQRGLSEGSIAIVDPSEEAWTSEIESNIDLEHLDVVSVDAKGLGGRGLGGGDDKDFDFLHKKLLYLGIRNCPVQVIAMETFRQTLQDALNSDFHELERLKMKQMYSPPRSAEWLCYHLLFRHRLKSVEKKHAAFLFQIVMALCCFQHHYSMCHNDLHIQNIMLHETKAEFIYYRVAGRFFRVPTHGFVLKVIDYGRATFELNGKLYMGDVFKYHAEAGEQYSYPYSHWKFSKQIPPNKSFDLCRLACSIIEDYYEDDPPEPVFPLREVHRGRFYTTSPIYNLLCEWTTDKYRPSVMRYDDFDLYKIIARRADNAVPEKQLYKEPFRGFRFAKKLIPPGTWVYSIS